MKKLLVIVVLLAAAGGGGYLVLTGRTSLYRSDVHLIKEKTRRFFECIKFKEFGQAAAFHDAADQKRSDIPKLIEDLFKVPPEQLDIQECQILFGEIDSSGMLGKVKTRCTVQFLPNRKVKNPDSVLYWKKEGGRWYLKLESSLRKQPEQ